MLIHKKEEKIITLLSEDITDLKKAKILLVEDLLSNREVIKEVLNKINCQITEAENGKEAISILKKQKIDLILMDIQMPIMDGYEATKIIKRHKKLNKIPIIAKRTVGKNINAANPMYPTNPTVKYKIANRIGWCIK